MAQSKAVLVTGSSRGIGLLTVRTLAKRGHYVYASMRAAQDHNKAIADELAGWAKDNNHGLEVIDLDVTDDESVAKAIDTIEAARPLDVLVNNAGTMPTGLTEGYTLDQMKECFEINVFGLARATRAVLPKMRERKSGVLIHLSSAAGRLAIPYFGVYCASKWAMEAYAESLHYELEGFGIESVIIEPSGHGTDLVKTAPAPADAERVAAYGPLAAGRDKLLGMFNSMFEQGEKITDAQNVADTIVGLVEADAARPIRTQIGADMGVEGINTKTAPIQAQIVEGLKPVYQGEPADA